MQPNAPLIDIPDEFREQCAAALKRHTQAKDSGCIVWTASLTPKGYGRFVVHKNGRHLNIRAHRAAWIFAYGPIADPNLVIDHLCRNRACLNPDHLELVTVTENRRRGIPHRIGPGSVAATSCRHGHPWPEHAKELLTPAGTPTIMCTACAKDARRRWRDKRHEQGDAQMEA